MSSNPAANLIGDAISNPSGTATIIPPAVIQVGDTGVASVVSGAVGSPLGSNVTIGNTVVLVIGVVLGTDQTSTVTSNRGTPALVVRQLGSGGTNTLEIWSLPVTSTGALSVTATTAGASNYRVNAIEATNCPTVSTGGTNSGAGLTAPTITINPVKPNQLIVAALASSSVPSAGPGAPWTTYNAGGWTFANRWSTAYQIQAASSPATATWTQPSGAAILDGAIAGT